MNVAAEDAGLKAGERIAAIEDGGERVESLMGLDEGRTITLVLADGSKRELTTRTFY